ncbi:hypothetical protein [Amycolatopsis sp. FDAARGOS 1241]|uniref:hypothetical protein n=1 Tax=Amycolatopsis sp. FDAARGOS 1241 TaxID=2778070 RepID=UPI001950FA5A|nr:hypothetical protein [Amycolatopsis sp. FDAARGOS 1241]QRP46211.1 hypothetical protein I6J71_45495 [Amycolatopsis sp. FDAARGOS 1241]
MTRLSDLITDVLAILRAGEHDTSWSSYDSTADAIEELERLQPRVEAGEREAVERFRFLCLPTGAIEEIAVSSGWSGRWLELVNGKYRDTLSPQ